ncbi:hypothetical protein GALL_173920 [mine drainage metagenome]|uniref:Uncharacterized protein n=1 Tax=mine drainage metagenome TaxID=410659 RepID=A0A1J5RX71_9ZZZZ
MAGSFGESAKASERLQPSLRAIRRNKRVLKEKILNARPVERYSPGGIYLGQGVAVPVDSVAHPRVLKRIVKGLYWHHFRIQMDQTTPITLVFIDKSKPNWQSALSVFGNLGPTHVQIGDGETFQYLYGRATDDDAFSFWLLIFFKGSGEQIVLAHTGKDHDDQTGHG